MFSDEPFADLPEVVSNEVPLVDYLEVHQILKFYQKSNLSMIVTPKTKMALVRWNDLLTQYLDLYRVGRKVNDFDNRLVIGMHRTGLFFHRTAHS